MLINEFGSVAIDHTLVRAYANHSRALSNGCACCDGDDALRASLLDLLKQIASGKLPGAEDIVLETSGVSDPSRIFGTIASEMHLAEYIEVANCVTVLEAGSDEDLIGRFPELLNQIASAGRIVVSKGDLHSAEVVRSTVALAHRLNPLAEVRVSNEQPDLEWLFAPATIPQPAPALPREHSNRFETFELEFDARLSWPEFSVWLTALLHCHGEQILRFKGVIPLSSSTSQALVLQGVRHRVHEPEHLDIDPSRSPAHFGLVFICTGRMETLVRDGLRVIGEVVQRLDASALA